MPKKGELSLRPSPPFVHYSVSLLLATLCDAQLLGDLLPHLRVAFIILLAVRQIPELNFNRHVVVDDRSGQLATSLWSPCTTERRRSLLRF